MYIIVIGVSVFTNFWRNIMLKKNIIIVVLIFITLSLLQDVHNIQASLPTNRALSFGDPKLPPPKQQTQTKITPAEQYKLNCANQQWQQSLNNIAQAGYNMGATLAIMKKK